MAAFKIMTPRRLGVRYHIDLVGKTFSIRTNLGAPDFRPMCAPEATPDAAAHWSELVPELPGRHLSHFEALETFVAADVGDEGGTAIRVFRCRTALRLIYCAPPQSASQFHQIRAIR